MNWLNEWTRQIMNSSNLSKNNANLLEEFDDVNEGVWLGQVRFG